MTAKLHFFSRCAQKHENTTREKEHFDDCLSLSPRRRECARVCVCVIERRRERSKRKIFLLSGDPTRERQERQEHTRRIKLKTEEPSMACVNVYKLLRRELKECCYSLLKMIMVINARVCIFFCYFCAFSSSLLRSAFPFLMHFDEIRVLVFSSSSSSSSNLHSHPAPVAIANARSFTIDRVT